MKLDAYLEMAGLIRGLAPEHLEALAKYGERVTLNEGQILVEEGSLNNDLYLVIRGRVAVTLPESLDRVGQVRLAERGPGDVIGEYSVFDRKPVSARVTTLEPAELMCLRAPAMERMEQTDPALAAVFYRNLLENLAKRLRDLDAEVDIFRTF